VNNENKRINDDIDDNNDYDKKKKLEKDLDNNLKKMKKP